MLLRYTVISKILRYSHKYSKKPFHARNTYVSAFPRSQKHVFFCFIASFELHNTPKPPSRVNYIQQTLIIVVYELWTLNLRHMVRNAGTK
jgi:hypothetical protein